MMIRGLGLRGAVAVNVITMIGIGPLITIPLVLANLHGSTALVAWIVGGIIALCDGLVYCELGSLYPGSGSTYVFLRETFGRERWGRFLAFLFAWQFVISAPLTIATGYIGFAHYAGYLWTPLATNVVLQGIVAACIGIVTLVLLYRPIHVVGTLGIALAGIALATLATLAAAGASHVHLGRALGGDPHVGLFAALAAGLGPALVITLYDYAGYGSSCAISDEVRSPARTLPASVLIAILGVGALYILVQLGVLGVVPWRELVAQAADGPIPAAANYVASTVVERTWGSVAARVVTIAILVTAFASTFGGLLAASRVPYAAAVDGVFLKPFARLHPHGRFPTVSLVVLGLLAIPPCFFSLGDVINALTAGIVLIQAIAQIVALGVVRARRVRAPYRMWGYPLPALVAFCGWMYIFISSGGPAIAYGLATLALGTLVFFWRARRAAEWPFLARAATVGALAFATACACGLRPSDAATLPTPHFGHARIVDRPGGDPIFEVDGKPFFVYGAAFFYERLPRETWAASMRALAELGINTLDLYVPWNWHELADGDFDFDGRTSPRRDLHEVLRLAREFDFKIILRPGPVIRNEWRNGGYPAWLLERPEYGMPLHDVLEGRYPATATLQNAHSDDAAAEWMRNATHLRYATRWLERALRESGFVADRIVAVALDDDQGAYIDNQTYPAPHLRAYLEYLRDVVQRVTGPSELTFINTYQMKVTASSPVWAMGNWYQSDAYALGEHDRAQLEFSMGLLHTRPHQPMMASEFQAGWLEQPGDVRPRSADPSNTSLALATMLGQGVRGIVNFPAQDTLYPTGWEAPFANGFYAWDAGLTLDGAHAARYPPMARIGALVRRFGAQLAAAQTRYDAAIAYTGASYGIAPSNDAYAKIAAATILAQQACRAAGLSCALVDPHALGAAELMRYPLLVVPAFDAVRDAYAKDVAETLARYRRMGGRLLLGSVTDAVLAQTWRATKRRRSVDGVLGASFAADPSHVVAGFLTVPNYADTPLAVTAATIATPQGPKRLAPFIVPAHEALVAAITGGRPRARAFDPSVMELTVVHAVASAKEPSPAAGETLPVRNDALLPSIAFMNPPAGRAIAYASDIYREGYAAVVLDSGAVRVVVAPQAGARAFIFQDDLTRRNVFTSVGTMRDDVAVEPPLSTTDRIAKYTHQFPAGTFNRMYRASDLGSGPRASATFAYDAPDVVPNGARFERTVTLAANARAFDVDERVTFAAGPATSDAQRAVSVTSLSVGTGDSPATLRLLTPGEGVSIADTTLRVKDGHALGYYDTATHELATIAWRAGDVEEATVYERPSSIVARLVLARQRSPHVRYGYERALSIEAARAALSIADRAAQIVTQGAFPAARMSP